jgi:shikimate dehydrogenase
LADVEAELEAAARAGVRGVRRTSRTVGIIGWPVDHSLSPAIHNAAFAALGLDWVYVPLPVRPGALAEALRGLPALGFAGANVTMPHKEESARACASGTEEVRLARAVNTIVVEPEGLAGHNTDVAGFARFLTKDAGFHPSGRTALLYGAGGAARACALALARDGLRTLTVVARSSSAAQTLRDVVAGLGTEIDVRTWEIPSVDADLVVNATPVGSDGTSSLPLPRLRPDQVAVDLLYRPAVTPLTAAAREAGASAFGGLGMLLHQAALSFELWTGHIPPIDVMSAAALAELSESP